MKNAIERLFILVRREMWESPVAFKWTPVIIFGFILLSTILALVIGMRVDDQLVFTKDGLRMWTELADGDQRLFLSGALFSISALFHQVMYLVLIFYLAGSLYDDRKDRSILFWKSLPVSDLITVGSKVAAACIMAPLLYLAGIIITQLTLLLIASVLGLMADINIISELWAPANLPKQWTLMLYGSLVQALWLIPLYGWLIFCSSWAPRLPILIAVLVPLLIGMLQHFWSFFSSFNLPEVNLLLIMLNRIVKGVAPASIEWDQISNGQESTFKPSEELFMSFGTVTNHLLSLEMWIGVAIGVVLLAGAVWFRRKATDN